MTNHRITLYFNDSDYEKLNDYAIKSSEITGIEISPNQILKSWITTKLNSLNEQMN